MNQPEQQQAEAPGKVIYTAKTHTTGGREHGASRSSDGSLDVKLSIPGSGRIGTNPEQLFAAGWSACFESAMGIAARKKRVTLPADLAIDAEVDLNQSNAGYFLRCASTSARRASRAKWPRPWWRRRTRPVPTPRRHGATSMSPSTSFSVRAAEVTAWLANNQDAR